jgi:hypothetical protein
LLTRKWTAEEEAYVQCLIEEFQAGYLPIREGTSLRSFLSKMLNCKPKRISKKFEGSDYNGKQVYVSQPYKLTSEEARQRRDRLCELERKFHQSVAELKKAEGLKQQSLTEEAGPAVDHKALAQQQLQNQAAQFNGSFGSGMDAGAFPGGGQEQNSQFLEELALQDMLRRRQQQHQSQQGVQQPPNGMAGSFVDPLLGNLGGLSRQHMNTTPLSSANDYWRRQQALLEASTQLDSLRMAQGSMGMQRSSLDPGQLRDLRMPPSMYQQNVGAGGGGGRPRAEYESEDYSKDGSSSGTPLKKRRVAQNGGGGVMKSARRQSDPPVAQLQHHQNFY